MKVGRLTIKGNSLIAVNYFYVYILVGVGIPPKYLPRVVNN